LDQLYVAVAAVMPQTAAIGCGERPDGAYGPEDIVRSAQRIVRYRDHSLQGGVAGRQDGTVPVAPRNIDSAVQGLQPGGDADERLNRKRGLAQTLRRVERVGGVVADPERRVGEAQGQGRILR